MGLLEDALRATFADQAGAAPAIEDAAGRAVRQAGRLRRRRTVAGTMAAVLALAVAGAGIVVVVDGPATLTAGPAPATVTPAPTPSVTPLPASILNGQSLVTVSGQVIDLAGIPEPRRASRTTGGWVIEADDHAHRQAQLWWIAEPPGVRAVDPPTGAMPSAAISSPAISSPAISSPATSSPATGPRFGSLPAPPEGPVLLAAGERVAVGVAGGLVQVAWGANGQVTVATLASGRLVAPASTTVTGLMWPVGFLVDGGVLLAEPTGLVDLWYPGRGPYRKGPQATAMAVTAVRNSIYAVDSQSCLVQLRPAGLSAQRSRCGLGLEAVQGLYPSPDGRWLAVIAFDRVILFDLETVWSRPAAAASWPLLANSIGWLADGTFAVTSEAARGAPVTLVRLRPGGWSGEPVTVDPGPGAAITVVADLGV